MTSQKDREEFLREQRAEIDAKLAELAKEGPAIYEGEYPVPWEWVNEHLEDESVGFVFTVDLDDLIGLDGIEGMNNYMDETLGLTGATLTDIRYYQHKADPADQLDDLVLIRAEGVLEED